MSTNTADVQTVTADAQVVVPSQSSGKSKAPAKPKSFESLVREAYRGEGALDGEALTALLSGANRARGVATAFPQASKDADAAVDAAMAALTAARDQARAVARQGGEANATLARVLYVVATKEVRGAVSMTGKEIAAAWGVTAGFISQYVSKGRAMHALGQTSPEAYALADAAYRKGRAALDSLVNTAQGIASASVPAQHEGEVKVTVAHMREAAAVVAPKPDDKPVTAPAPAGDVRVTAVTRQVRNTLDTVKAAYKTDRLRCTAEDLTHARAALAALAAFLDTVQPDAQA